MRDRTTFAVSEFFQGTEAEWTLNSLPSVNSNAGKLHKY